MEREYTFLLTVAVIPDDPAFRGRVGQTVEISFDSDDDILNVLGAHFRIGELANYFKIKPEFTNKEEVSNG